MQTIALSQTLYLVRHGETDWNVDGRLQGGQDIPLNDTGRAQAAEAAHRLRDMAVPCDAIDFVCSPMLRAQETMTIVRRSLGLQPDTFRTEDLLREITFGIWEGLTWRQVRRQDPDRASFRERDKWGYVPPEGESYRMLAERIRPWLVQIDRPTLVVSHGGVARAILALAGLLAPADAATTDIWQGKILVISPSGFAWH